MVEHAQAHSSQGRPTPAAPPSPEISPARVGVLLLVLAVLAFGAWRLIGAGTSAASAKSAAVPVYAPYVDVTQTPTYPFQLPSASPVSSIYLAFVVSNSSRPCTPSWGDYYTLDQAERSLNLDSRTAQLRREGGTVMVSFGGRDNSELAVGCTNASELADAYRAPIERYRATTIDLDLEGNTLADAPANARRATAIATIQRAMAARHTSLRVWMTLPVSSDGLTPAGLAAVQAMLVAHVKLAGVNAMAMDFGPGEGASPDMLGMIERALDQTQRQVQSLWRTAGLSSSPASAWGHLGVTVMLGVNEGLDERFTTDDAKALAAFVNRHGIPRVSAWSLNRDSECGGAFARIGVVSNTCSGVLQEPLEFTHIFDRLKGTKVASPQIGPPAPQQETAVDSSDDPATSPYPIWRSTAPYLTGYKVVWQKEIYQASWWNQGTPPDASGADSPTGPWQPIGPVPAGSRAAEPVTLAPGTFRAWSPQAVYRQGDRVSFGGLPYQARWYTQGDQPLSALPVDPGTPWEPLFKYPGEPTAAGAGTEAK